MHGNAAEAAAAALRVLADARTDCPFGLVYLVDEVAGSPARRRTRHRRRR